MFSLAGLCLLILTAALKNWPTIKLNIKVALLQTVPAQCDVYVIPPRKSQDRDKRLWLLLDAAYGLMSSNAKLHVQPDAVLQ